jgi:hypothetical protein
MMKKRFLCELKKNFSVFLSLVCINKEIEKKRLFALSLSTEFFVVHLPDDEITIEVSRGGLDRAASPLIASTAPEVHFSFPLFR